jgi:Zn-finger nucleic acid-binding protein
MRLLQGEHDRGPVKTIRCVTRSHVRYLVSRSQRHGARVLHRGSRLRSSKPLGKIVSRGQLALSAARDLFCARVTSGAPRPEVTRERCGFVLTTDATVRPRRRCRERPSSLVPWSLVPWSLVPWSLVPSSSRTALAAVVLGAVVVAHCPRCRRRRALPSLPSSSSRALPSLPSSSRTVLAAVVLGAVVVVAALAAVVLGAVAVAHCPRCRRAWCRRRRALPSLPSPSRTALAATWLTRRGRVDRSQAMRKPALLQAGGGNRCCFVAEVRATSRPERAARR